MTMNRVQFQRALSIAEFMDRYGSDEKCEAALIESRWPAGFACPACGCGHSSSFRRKDPLYFQCTACRHQCSVISGTIFGATKLGAVALVHGHAPSDPVQEQRRGAQTDAPPERLLQDRLAR